MTTSVGGADGLHRGANRGDGDDRAGGDGLPGTDMNEWLDKRRKDAGQPHEIAASEGEVHILLSKDAQSARRFSNGEWRNIPIEEALALAGDKFGGAR